LIGKINVGGFTRGTRIYAGTMVFTLINQHWVNNLLEQAPWLKNYGRLKADELPLFDLMIVCANEYGASVQMFIYGVDITDEGQVLSIEDIFTENTFSFVARDLTCFSSDGKVQEDFKAPKTIKTISTFDIKYDKSLNPENLNSDRTDLQRTITYNPANMLTGEDVIKIQTMLNNTGAVSIPITGSYDTQTFEAVKTVQSKYGLKITGAVDDDTYKTLVKVNGSTNNPDGTTTPRGLVINKSGTTVYSKPDTSSTQVTKYNYKDNIEILGTDGDKWYQTDKGYVSVYDVYTYLNDKSSMTFTEVRVGDKGFLVTMAQNAINTILASEGKQVAVSGIMDQDTVDAVKQIQSKYGLTADGIINKETWLALQEHSNIGSQAQKNGTVVSFINEPRTYNVHNVSPEILSNYGSQIITGAAPQQVKITALAHYPNGKSKEYTKSMTVDANSTTTVSPAMINDAFLYNPYASSTPKTVEFIVYPVNGTPYKWTLNIGE
jgi:peptidoglycan hydrolase-like protein with peptidoglycan-binding domain